MSETIQAMEVLELANTIEADGTTYNINAVHAENANQAEKAADADVAGKVANALFIKSVGLGGTELANPIQFNGSEEKTITVVPASGGKFTGPVRVGNVKNTANSREDGSILADAVLNYNDIINVVLKSLITNSTTYEWKRNEQIEGEPLELFPGITEGTINGISIVTGDEADLVAFEATNNSDNKLLAFIYICLDTGSIYFGGAKIALVKLAINAEKIISVKDPTKFYDYDKIAALDVSINGNGTESGLIIDIETISNELRRLIATNATNISNIINGVTEVGKSNQASSATKATNDANNKAIHYNYYRINATTSDNRTTEKIITISQNGPSGGNIGDIWIQYKA
jgi:hypothetical protein